MCTNAWGVGNRAAVWGSKVGVCMEAGLLQEITPGCDVGGARIARAGDDARRMYAEDRISIPCAKTCQWNLGEKHSI